METITDTDAQALVEIWSHLAKSADALGDWAGRTDETAELRVRTAADKAAEELRLVAAHATALAQRVESEAADWDVEQVAVLDDVFGGEQ